jgi:hypothetical protein
MKYKYKIFMFTTVLSAITGVFLTTSTTYADTPVDACFTMSVGTITAYETPGGPNNCPTNVDIPATVGGIPVTGIGNDAFEAKGLTGLTIPSSVTSIGSDAFYNNQIPAVIIPSGLTTISSRAFGSNNLTSITIPAGITEIGNNAFSNNYITAVDIPSSVTAIRNGAFSVNQIETLTLHTGLTTIESQAFTYNHLTDVDIPDTVTTIEYGVFGLQSVDLDGRYMRDNLVIGASQATINAIYGQISFVRLYTESPSNPNNILSDSLFWYDMGTDWDGDGVVGTATPVGGHLVNPARGTANHIDTNSNTIAPSVQVTGDNGGTFLSNYRLVDAPNNIPTPGNVFMPSNGERVAIDAALAAVYYQIGESHVFTAPTISGYTLQSPASPHTLTLALRDNAFDFIYLADGQQPQNPQQPQSPQQPPQNPSSPQQSQGPSGNHTSSTLNKAGSLPDTGTNIYVAIAMVAMAAIGATVTYLLAHKNKQDLDFHSKLK